jgi:hypothetical protein
MNIKINAAARLKATEVDAMSNTQGGVLAEVSDALRRAKYEVRTSGASSLIVSNGTIANVAALLKNSGWKLNSTRTELHHPQIDYYIKLSEAKGTTTLRIVD